MRTRRVLRYFRTVQQALDWLGVPNVYMRSPRLARRVVPRTAHKNRSFWERRDLPELFEQAKARYVALARAWHPDKGGDPVYMAALNEAWALIRKRFAQHRWLV